MCVPKLRFFEFNGEWEEKKLGDIAKLSGRIGFRGYRTSDLVEKGEGALTLGGKHISKNNKLDLKDPEYLSWEKYYESPEIMIEVGDIITAQRGTLGRSAIIHKEIGAATINPSMILIKHTKILNFYLYYYMSNKKFKKDVIVNSSSTAVPMISQSEMKKIKITHPNLKEQQKIASFLSKVDEKIEKLEKKLKLWENYKKGMMQQIFSQKLRFKDENGEDYPEWEEKNLNKISNINPKSERLPEEFVYIDLESVESGVLKKQALITKDEAPSRAQRILQNNDILYQTVRPYQRNNLFFNSTSSRIYVASTGYAQIRSKEDSKFIYHVLHTDDFVNKVLARCTGTSYPAINSKDLGKIKLNVPSILEQEKVSKFISAIGSKINQLNIELDMNKGFKKGLLQQMFC